MCGREPCVPSEMQPAYSEENCALPAGPPPSVAYCGQFSLCLFSSFCVIIAGCTINQMV